jgi:hypothetical protein
MSGILPSFSSAQTIHVEISLPGHNGRPIEESNYEDSMKTKTQKCRKLGLLLSKKSPPRLSVYLDFIKEYCDSLYTDTLFLDGWTAGKNIKAIKFSGATITDVSKEPRAGDDMTNWWRVEKESGTSLTISRYFCFLRKGADCRLLRLEVEKGTLFQALTQDAVTEEKKEPQIVGAVVWIPKDSFSEDDNKKIHIFEGTVFQGDTKDMPKVCIWQDPRTFSRARSCFDPFTEIFE